jgi:hypothetical protein
VLYTELRLSKVKADNKILFFRQLPIIEEGFKNKKLNRIAP